MSYSPGYSEIVPPMVSVFTVGWSYWATERASGSEPLSGTYESADRAVYSAILVPVTCVVRRLWWVNGSTVSASYNIDVGIYADASYLPASRIISTGSTAQGTASEVQFVNVTDTTLSPGRYWLAIACSSASATLRRTSTVAALDAAWRFEEASALPLPASATPVESTSTSGPYLCGFATTASP